MKIKILHLENSASDALLVDEELKKSDFEFEIKLVDTRNDFTDALKNFGPDIILSDHSLQSFDSLEALEIVKEKRLNIPFIVVSATVSEEFAANVIKHGAFHYISKYKLKSLPGVITTAIDKSNNKLQNSRHRSESGENKIESNEALAQMADRLTLATRICKFAIWDWDIINNKMIWDNRMYENYGLTPGTENVAHDFRDRYVHKEDLIRARNEIQLALSGEKEYEIEFRVIWPDQSTHYIKEIGIVQRNISGSAVRMLATNQDISKHKKMEEELIENKLKLEKEKAQVILVAQEKEREIIGYELHDNVNQVLASAKMYIDLFETNSKEQKIIKTKSREYLFIAMEEIRKLSKQLVVSHINNIGLIGSIEGFISDLADLQLFEIEFIYDDERIEELLPLKKTALFRILQEQMKNVIKHSQAKNVWVDLHSSNSHATLSIKDDGVGFDATKAGKGLGLSHIFERTDLYNGKVELRTAPNQGCTVVIDFPFE